jgi:hypothetical protein
MYTFFHPIIFLSLPAIFGAIDIKQFTRTVFQTGFGVGSLFVEIGKIPFLEFFQPQPRGFSLFPIHI